LGTAEVEDALDQHPSVAESAVVGYPHDIKGEGIYAYITLKHDCNVDDNIIADLKMIVRQKIAGYAIPDLIQFCSGLPKTRSGKIMRRILRKVAANQSEDLGDVSTLADPSVVAVLVANHQQLMNKH